MADLSNFSPNELHAYLSNPLNNVDFNEERWYGMSHLHDACVKSSPENVRILLEHGHAFNISNMGGETPFHLAARRGIVKITQELKRAGADVFVLDKLGRSALHFAAFGGHTMMINYLLLHCEIKKELQDRDGNTFFHLLCLNRKIDAVYFCLKNNILSSNQIKKLRNSSGFNPFDISLENLCADIPFLILTMSEFSILSLGVKNDGVKDHVFNHDKIIANKVHPSYKQLYRLIKFHILFTKLFRRPVSKPLLGPWLSYIWLLLKSLFLPPLLYIFFNFSPEIPVKGLAFYLTSIFFTLFYKSENYRMSDVSKWPNPFLFGLFFSGIFYDILFFYFVMKPSLSSDSVFNNMWFYYCCLSLTIILLYLYIRLVFSNPGYATSETLPRHNGIDCIDVENEKLICVDFYLNHCPYCQVQDKLHRHHCRLCNTCMTDYDHHCLFLLTCIASNNRRLFLIFLAFVDLVCIPLFLFVIYNHIIIVLNFENESFLFTLFMACYRSLTSSYQAMLIVVTLSNICVWCWIAYLLYNQIKFIAKGHTTSCSGIESCKMDLSKKTACKSLFRSFIMFMITGKLHPRS